MLKRTTQQKVRPALSADAEWIKKIYAKNKKHLGSFDLFMSWQKYMTGSGGHFKVLSDIGFIRYSWMNKYGANVVHEIGITEEHQGKGFGKILLHQVPVPVLLKCNKDNDKGNAFYASVGMQLAGETQTRKGVKQLVWTKSKPW